jgi:hypothetical protein
LETVSCRSQYFCITIKILDFSSLYTTITNAQLKSRDFCFTLSTYVCCGQCCPFLWIVHSWLPLRFSLTFLFLLEVLCHVSVVSVLLLLSLCCVKSGLYFSIESNTSQLHNTLIKQILIQTFTSIESFTRERCQISD